MLVKEQDEVLVLAQVEQGEASRVFTVLAKNRGRFKLLAKGERKILSKLRKGIDLFYLTKITFIETPARIILTDVDLIDSFPALREDWRKFRLATRIANLLNDILPLETAEEEVFFLTKESFEDLSQAERYLQRYYYYYLWQLLKVLGYCPETIDASFDKTLRSNFLKNIAHSKINWPRSDFFLNSIPRSLIKIILAGEKEVFYKTRISPTDQKNLARVSHLYLDSLALAKDSYSLNFKL